MKRVLIYGTIVLAIAFTGCNDKDKQKVDPIPNNQSATVEEFFANNGASEQTFKINVDNGNVTVTGEQGTAITFPEDVFVDLANQPVTGEIDIDLIEIYEKESMVLSGKPTVSNGQLLISGGEIFIEATSNGQELKLKDNMSILIEFPTSEPINDSMTLFVGADTLGQFNWNQVPNVMPNQMPDTSWNGNVGGNYFYYNPDNYIYSYTNLGWINCDRFYNVPTTNITIQCNSIVDDNANLRAFLVFKNMNSVLSAYAYTGNPVGNFGATNIPIGESITLIVLYFKEGKEYIALKDVTVSTNLSLNVDLTEKSETEIVDLIKEKL